MKKQMTVQGTVLETADLRDPSFRDRPKQERPRERLAFLGAKELNDEELVALVFGSGAAIPMARLLLDRAGGLVHLRKMGFFELCQLPGVGPAKASQLKAALELGRRAQLPVPLSGFLVESPQDVADLLRAELAQGEQEGFYVFGLDAKHRIVWRHTAAVGQVDQVHVSSRDVFFPLVREGVAAALVAHNHPSGDPTPSPQDIALTKHLQQAAQLLGITLLDHIVVAQNGYVSLAEQGVLSQHP